MQYVLRLSIQFRPIYYIFPPRSSIYTPKYRDVCLMSNFQCYTVSYPTEMYFLYCANKWKTNIHVSHVGRRIFYCRRMHPAIHSTRFQQIDCQHNWTRYLSGYGRPHCLSRADEGFVSQLEVPPFNTCDYSYAQSVSSILNYIRLIEWSNSIIILNLMTEISSFPVCSCRNFGIPVNNYCPCLCWLCKSTPTPIASSRT